MVDFKKIDEMIEIIENNQIPEGKTFNEFVIEFFNEVKTIPLSKYLRTKGKDKRLPKIMNSKKAGEVLIDTKKDDEIQTFLKRKGYKEIPELDYKAVMLLRKTDLFSNWKKLILYFEGAGTVQEINNSTKPTLLPQEVEILENYLKKELNITEQEFNWLISKFSKIQKDKEMLKALKKLAR
ncbi:MAG: hypothetical protein Q4B33_03170 [Fusobacterium sp.]|nr:hypothetical protein [Fusobacterium sp.]